METTGTLTIKIYVVTLYGDTPKGACLTIKTVKYITESEATKLVTAHRAYCAGKNNYVYLFTIDPIQL